MSLVTQSNVYAICEHVSASRENASWKSQVLKLPRLPRSGELTAMAAHMMASQRPKAGVFSADIQYVQKQNEVCNAGQKAETLEGSKAGRGTSQEGLERSPHSEGAPDAGVACDVSLHPFYSETETGLVLQGPTVKTML